MIASNLTDKPQLKNNPFLAIITRISNSSLSIRHMLKGYLCDSYMPLSNEGFI